jgi:peptide/nickel transport system substrate-binding protein
VNNEDLSPSLDKETQSEKNSANEHENKKGSGKSTLFSEESVRKVISTFSHKERKIFLLLLCVLFIGVVGTLLGINESLKVEVPARGGTLTEGVLGAPRFINPLLAISDADRDLTSLVYSGLMRPTHDGNLIPDLAESYNVSEDGLAYTFTIKKGLTWHDGEPITSDDVLFTISMVQDSVLKSPKRASWEGVATQKTNERTFTLTLAQQYSPFLENTTLGILPKHIWGNISSEQFGFSNFNIEPVGSGPFKVEHIKRNSSGIPLYYSLKSFSNFALGEPYLKTLRIQFYSNEDEILSALSQGKISAVNALRAEKARELEEKKMRVERYVLPRIFGVFFNQSQNTIFTDKIVRKALNISVDRESLIQEVLLGYATAIDGPLPPGALGYTEKNHAVIPIETSAETTQNDNTDDIKEVPDSIDQTHTPAGAREAIALLEKNGWKINEETGLREKNSNKETSVLKFSISTSDAQELKLTAQNLKSTWELLGAQVDLKIFNTGDLNQNVIRPRKYDALLFGEIIGRESDPFAFWHSSQRNDPGLNIALYANITTDKLLEDGRVSFEKETRMELYEKFEEEVKNDIPAIFIYSPDFIYILPTQIKGGVTGTIAVPSERFMDIYEWYTQTNKVWKVFAPK